MLIELNKKFFINKLITKIKNTWNKLEKNLYLI